MTQIMEIISKLNKLVFEICGFQVSDFVSEKESVKYHACSFYINDRRIVYRNAKITPTKIGQFVTFWNRYESGVTQPFDSNDPLDLVVINTTTTNHLGQFVFPKLTLIEQGILSSKTNNGKRGFRVYPPWDKTSSKQASKTQAWQLDYFLPYGETLDINRVKKLYLQE